VANEAKVNFHMPYITLMPTFSVCNTTDLAIETGKIKCERAICMHVVVG